MSAGNAGLTDPYARVAYYADLGRRADRIAERLHPVPRGIHGFQHPDLFVLQCQQIGRRDRAAREIFHRLRERHGERIDPAPLTTGNLNLTGHAPDRKEAA